MNKIKVLIVDDSALVRQVSSEIINSVPGFELLGAAHDPIFAMAKMKQQWPDVIVLDIEMPRMDGLTFLKKLMRERPTPVIICSTLTEKGAASTMEALSYGAVDIITKPKVGVKAFFQNDDNQLVNAIKSAAKANVKRMRLNHTLISKPTEKLTADAMLPPVDRTAMVQTTHKVIAIGTSTGGTQALEVVLTALPAVTPGIIVVQHMPANFTRAFAERLNNICQIEVKEGTDNDRVLPGQALIAPGGKHMMLKRQGAQYFVQVKDGPLVSRHRPSVDVLFRSVAKYAGRNALGIIMTGMGDDGANGLKEMSDQGARTIAQNEATCVVYGMPKEAIKRGAVNRECALQKIPQEIIDFDTE